MHKKIRDISWQGTDDYSSSMGTDDVMVVVVVIVADDVDGSKVLNDDDGWDGD